MCLFDIHFLLCVSIQIRLLIVKIFLSWLGRPLFFFFSFFFKKPNDSILSDDLVQVLTPVTGVANSGALYFRLPFDLSEYAKAKDWLTQPKYYVRVSLASNSDCFGSSGHFHVDGGLSSLSLATAPAQSAYATGSIFEVRIVAEGAPSRDVQCDLIHSGVLFDTAEERIATYRTGSATTRQAKLVRHQLPQQGLLVLRRHDPCILLAAAEMSKVGQG